MRHERQGSSGARRLRLFTALHEGAPARSTCQVNDDVITPLSLHCVFEDCSLILFVSFQTASSFSDSMGADCSCDLE